MSTDTQNSAPVSAVPQGWRLVPIEPTVTMRIMGGSAAVQAGGSWGDVAVQAYKAMLDAAPVAAQAQQYASGGNLADRLDGLADTASPGSQMQSDLYAAATIWRKHLKGPAAQQPVSGADAGELPDAVRVPLDSLHADAGYLVGRALDQSLSSAEVVSVIRSRIDAARAALAQQDADKADVWQCTTTLTESDDLIWLYCQDTNTIDGPVASSPEFIDSWTHWAWVEHPSTASIDTARKEHSNA
ncbi:hypothetical protein DUD43_07200 [Alcaligenes faecalis]|uniref:hypothetical protein n=1 Tax=Alcaligenes faecalis TaxID=511 RepID=UPI0012932FC3|nr:hypothetical protein [Alcaligenes faecalis]QFY77487.1 hypothetical protein DUD43_07200 [Alcaligenes faecalis]